MRSHAWYYRFRGDPGVFGPLRFTEKVTEKEARKRLRRIYNYDKRLPNGVEVWPTTH